MSSFNRIGYAKQIKKEFLLTLKIILILTVILFIIVRDYTLRGFFLTLTRTALYTFILAFGQGVLNNFITSKWDWVKQTNKRVWAGIISIVLYTIPAILLIHYILFVKVDGLPEERFFDQQFIWVHLFWMLFSFAVSSFLHAREFMI